MQFCGVNTNGKLSSVHRCEIQCPPVHPDIETFLLSETNQQIPFSSGLGVLIQCRPRMVILKVASYQI